MRKALNENPVVQIGVVGVLIAVVGLIFMMNMGGGGGGAESASTSDPTGAPVGSTSASSPTGEPQSAESAAAPVPTASMVPLGSEPPPPVMAAYDRGDVVVLLVISEDGIEDAFVRRSVEALRGEPDATIFVVTADRIARFSRLTQGVSLSRVPALVVVHPKRLSEGEDQGPTAQVHYGYRGPQNVVQLVRDASYEGQPASYGPG